MVHITPMNHQMNGFLICLLIIGVILMMIIILQIGSVYMSNILHMQILSLKVSSYRGFYFPVYVVEGKYYLNEVLEDFSLRNPPLMWFLIKFLIF
ncbi:hypothetical protein O3M35_009867 [Rhynocoris fuscipes]|uniref:Uncharacterized protein n=1 Tax=Rhynocoris fuscipes TaxID=488301 RepID=A0AAW1DBI6_9HEMI